jgi:Cu+-exporting ATPase
MFGKNGLYIKNTSVIEKLSHIDTIVFDKTGTLTRPNENSISWSGKVLSDQEKNAIFSLARQSTHPLSIALLSELEEAIYTAPEHFVEVAGRGIFGKVGQQELKMGSAEYVRASGGNGVQKASEVHVSVNEEHLGYYTISNQYREGFDTVLKTLKSDFSLYLVSGDNNSEALNLAPHFEKDRMYFNQKPGDKADLIQALQQKGHTVLMTGDGLNDAGALMQSDVALTVANKVYHFSPASDAVLEAGIFQKLARFIRFTRTSLNIVKLSFLISFLYNIVGISFAITGNLSPIVAAILMPVSSVSVVAFATFVTRASARSLRSAAKD